MIHADRLDEVFGTVGDLIGNVSTREQHRALHLQALQLARDTASAAAVFAPIDLPLAVADVLGRPHRERIAVAAASTLLWTGADLLDDLADGQLHPAWSVTSPHVVTLVAVNLLATLPHLVAARVLDHPSPDAVARFGRSIATTTWRMSEGQWRDLAGPSGTDSNVGYQLLVEQKSGAEMGFFAGAPAILADLPDAVRSWTDFGERFGAMMQAFSDVASVFVEGSENDLLRGKRPVPVRHTLETLSGVARERFQHVLDRAADGDTDAVAEAVETMISVGAARVGLLHVELLRFRATKSLPICLSEYPVDHPIRFMLRSCSVV